MTHYPPDIRYACAQLGLPAGATHEQALQVVANATAYRFMTRDRVEHVQRFADFIAARARISLPHDTFERIRKGYHRQAMALHPDTNKGDQKAEEKLKAIITAYKIIEDVHKEALEFFRKDDATRAALEEQLRQTTLRETPGASQTEAPPQPQAQARPASPPPKAEAPRAGAVKYMAASIPRYIRNARLFYLSSNAVIGSRAGGNIVYDIIMLPEKDFMRARINLSLDNSGRPELSMSKITPPYIPIDTKEISVQPEEADPYNFARAHFQQAFGLNTAGVAT